MADSKVIIELEIDGRKVEAQIEKSALIVENKFKQSGKKSGDSFSQGLGNSIQTGISSFVKGTIVFGAVNKVISEVSQTFREAAQNVRDFSRGVAEINTLLPQTERIGKNVENVLVGFSSQFGTSAAQQAKSFYDVVSAGVQGTSNRLQTLQIANKAAVAGLVDINAATKTLVQSVNAYAKSGLTTEQASDILFATVREGVTTFGELSDFIGNATGVAASAGVSFSDLSGSIAFLTKSGLNTDTAVTGLRQAIASIINPTKEAKDEAKRLGIQFNASALETKGFRDFILDISRATNGSTESLGKLFGNIRAFSAVNIIANGNLKDFNRILDATKDSASATADAFQVIAKNFDFQLKQREAEIAGIGLAISRAFVQTFGNSLALSSRNMVAFIKQSIIPFGQFVNDFIIAPFELVYNVIRSVVSAVRVSIQSMIVDSAKAVRGLVSALPAFLVPDGWKKNIQDFVESSSEVLTDFAVQTNQSFNDIYQGTLWEKNTELLTNLEENLAISTELINQAGVNIGNGFAEGIDKAKNAMVEFSEDAKARAKLVNDAINQAVTSVISQGIQTLVKGLMAGKIGFADFARSVLGTVGEMSIKLGESLILTGLGMEALTGLEGGQAIVAGAGLIALGTILKSFSGGQGAAIPTTGGGVGLGTGFDGSGSAVNQPTEKEERKPQTTVAVNIQGDVLDSEESGLRIVSLIQNAFDKNDVKVQGAFA